MEQLALARHKKKMQQSKKEIQDALSKSSQDFCSNLRYLTNMLWLRNQKNEDITTLKRRITIATNSNPITIIEIAGPQFFKYRDSLKARQIDFFLNRDYIEEVHEVQQTHKVEGDTSSAGEVIDIIKQTFKSFKETEKTIILNKAIEMLSSYVQYLINTKKLLEYKKINSQ